MSNADDTDSKHPANELPEASEQVLDASVPVGGQASAELTLGGERLRRDRAARSAEAQQLSQHARLVHELQVHQIELEMQNRELREAQNALEESRNRYADLYDFAPIAYFTFDERGVICDVNLTGATMLGRERAQLLGLPFVALIQMSEPALFWAHLRKCVQTRRPVVSELCFSSAGREPTCVQVLSVPVLDGLAQPVRFRTAFTDITARKRAEDARTQAEARLRELFENAPDGIWLSDPEGRCLAINEAAVRLMGYARDEVVGRSGAEFLEPDDLPRFAAHHAALREGEDRVAQWRARRKDGTWVWVEGSGRRLADGRLQTFFRDISERHRTEWLLQRAGERFELALKGADLAAWDWNVQTGEVVYGARWAQMRGLPPEQVPGKVDTWAQGVHPDDWEAVQRALNDHFEGKTPEYEVEHRTLTASGEWIWILDRGRVLERDAQGKPLRMLGTELDITARKQAEAERARAYASEQRLRARLEALDHASMAVSAALASEASSTIEAVVEVVKHQACLIADAEQAELELGNAAGAPRQESTAEGAQAPQVASDDALQVPLEYAQKPLGLLTVRRKRTGGAFGEEDGRTLQMLAERAASALENASLLQELRTAVRSRDNLLAVVSHDLRSPLNAISLSASALAPAKPDQERRKSRTQIELIRRSARWMSELIDDLLTVSVIESAAFVVSPGAETPGALIAEACQFAEPLLATKSLTLEQVVLPGLPAVHADRHRIRQVLANLIGNALKFAPVASTIRVEARTAADGVCFAVSDTGPGIAPHELTRVFERCWTGDTHGKGLGLGLYIARGIVAAHGQQMWVESKLGAGATFYFTLPLLHQAAEQPALPG